MTLKLFGCALATLAAAVAHAGPAPHSISAEPAMVTAGAAPRAFRDVAWVRHGALDRAGLGEWTAIYDHDTDVPLRMWGPSQAAAGAMASPAAAEAWARAFLATHLDMLAPGATPDDFVVVANQLNPSGDLRSVGFAQSARGVAVLGGTISFAFKNDRMIMAGSTALPNVALAPGAQPGQRLAAARVMSAATSWLAGAGHPVAARMPGPAAQVIVPIVRPRGAQGVDISYTLAEQVVVESTTGEPGRWNVFVDAGTGAAFARETALMFGSGTVQFDVPVHGPAADAGRHALPAPNAVHSVNGAAVTSDLDGVVTWNGNAAATVVPGLTGPLVSVIDKAGSPATDTLSLAAGGSLTWSKAGVPAADAQLSAFVAASQAKRFAKTRINPALPYFDRQLLVNVNETPGTCNAYSTGDDIHFFPQTPGMCENAARVTDLVYHEFGHSVHRQSLIPGVGQFNAAMSEGVGDTFAVAITGDSGMGRGFTLTAGQTNEPLREMNPDVKKVYPGDLINEVHHDGEIYGETMWDLRTNLQTSMGVTAGFDQFLKIFYGTVQRAADIPSSFAEALAADDDDGNLSNGTPHDCDIIAAFLAHGLYDPIATGEAARPVRNQFSISIAVPARPTARCQVPSVESAQIDWRPRKGTFEAIRMIGNGTVLAAAIPVQPPGTVIEYSVTLTLSNGTTQIFPNNNADPLYQFYVGEVTKVWCADFEDGGHDWTHSAMPDEDDFWSVGPPQGAGGDPRAAFRGNNVLGLALGGSGIYGPSMSTAAVSPNIDIHDAAKLRLQYYRWLGVEDGLYDQATVKANGTEVWRNATSSLSPAHAQSTNSAYNHIDREWRFQDIDVSKQAASGKIQLTFGLASDASFQAGGWNIDDVCLVVPAPICGNGTVEPGESCDDGNTVAGDGCSATCEDEGGCCSAGGDPAAPAALAVVTLGFVVLRRRTQAAAAALSRGPCGTRRVPKR